MAMYSPNSDIDNWLSSSNEYNVYVIYGTTISGYYGLDKTQVQEEHSIRPVVVVSK